MTDKLINRPGRALALGLELHAPCTRLEAVPFTELESTA